jgi:hypothetical protein
MPAVVFLSLADPTQERLWRLALGTQQVDVRSVPPSRDLLHLVAEVAREETSIGVLLDIAAYGRLRHPLEEWVQRIIAAAPLAHIVAVRAGVTEVSSSVVNWATACGVKRVIGDLRGENAWSLVSELLHALPGWAAEATLSEERFRSFQRSMNKELTLARVTDPLLNAGRLLAARKVTTEALAAELRRAVPPKDRRYRLTNYRICFVAEAAVAWLAERLGVTRDQAVHVGRLLQAEGRLYHVLHEHDFSDGYLFFRYAGDPSLIDALDLAIVVARLRAAGGLDIETREWKGTRYPQCFTGAGFVERLGALFPVGVEEAASVGQLLIDLGIMHHVADAHPFIDGEFFYRFYSDENGR